MVFSYYYHTIKVEKGQAIDYNEINESFFGIL